MAVEQVRMRVIESEIFRCFFVEGDLDNTSFFKRVDGADKGAS